MLIQEKIGHINTFEIKDQSIDLVLLEWYEASKRILRKTTVNGKEILLKFLNANPELTDGDILYADENNIISVSVLPCNCIVMQPKNIFEVASLCYEIGNKHLPLFYEADELLVPFETPLFNLLSVQGYGVKQEERKLLHPLKTTVAPHNLSISDNVFSMSGQIKTSAE
jgi:urease accessory protein